MELLNIINAHALFVIAVVHKHCMCDVLRPHKNILGLRNVLDKIQWVRMQLLGTYPDFLLHMQTSLQLSDFRFPLLCK
jgi:hypothetical protein